MTQNSFSYKVGDGETRPWGAYEVTACGSLGGDKEFCEKRITVLAGQILSLQSHALRGEVWRVESGVLTVILNDSRRDLEAGETIDIPLGSLHAMANLTDRDCVVFERQEGVCRESDIRRFYDAYGRSVDTLPEEPHAAESLRIYQNVLAELKNR